LGLRKICHRIHSSNQFKTCKFIIRKNFRLRYPKDPQKENSLEWVGLKLKYKKNNNFDSFALIYDSF
jgi:hypothetical protein